MKFNCGPTYETLLKTRNRTLKAEAERLKQWHEAFAWLPVRISDDVCIWLEKYERRYEIAYVRWCYDRNRDILVYGNEEIRLPE